MKRFNRVETNAKFLKEIEQENLAHPIRRRMQRRSHKLFLSLCISFLCCLISCVSTLGSSYAWFTDSVSNTGNRVKAGTLDVELLMYKDDGYKNISNGNGDIFKESNSVKDSNETLWEPGKTQFVYLAVKNNGNLALSYNIVINVTDGGLASALEYAIANKAYDEITIDEIKALTMTPLSLGEKGQIQAAPNGKLSAGETDYFVFVLHMDEEADASYMDKEIVFDVNVLATQTSEELDGYDSSSYDETATLPTVDNVKHVRNMETLNYVIGIGGQGKLDSDLSFEEDVEVTNDFTLDLKGKSLSFSKANQAFDIHDDHTVTIINTSDDPANIILGKNLENNDIVLTNNTSKLIIKEGKYKFDPSLYVLTDNYNITSTGEEPNKVWTVEKKGS